MKGEVHKHHELTEKLRREKEASQEDFQKHKEKVEAQVKVSLSPILFQLPFFNLNTIEAVIASIQ